MCLGIADPLNNSFCKTVFNCNLKPIKCSPLNGARYLLMYILVLGLNNFNLTTFRFKILYRYQ